MIPEPFSFRIDSFVRGLDFAYPNSVKIGGLASGVTRPGQDSLFLAGGIYDNGLIGVAISGNVVVESIVAQGCKPVGPSFRITRCKKNLLYELDGEPAVMILKKVIDGLSGSQRDLIKDSVFLGVVMDETKSAHQSGDFLIRNILGIEPVSGALVVGELLVEQRTVRFHVRDAASSADDLRLLLKQYKDEALCAGEKQAAGALLFSCLGRGEQLYGRKNHDSDCLRNFLGSVPIGGFFCNGEIGPVGNTTFLHGYTSSFGIFREKII
ncbi:MAG: FIST C-terminal domain-containing protein [Candidatus Obscuribacterales bacterium]|nr:FIST C-terminal domain-containing protein [Candidatus Obscuribacterales bacterium]